MKTVSVCVENLCVPCGASCRYCLLSSCREAAGVSYQRGKAFALRLSGEISERLPHMRFHYYIGYCMDTPDLPDYISLCRQHNWPGGEFLQMNGFAFRNQEETENLMASIRQAGVELIDLTFYGTREYHDRFAGRIGDYDFLRLMLRAAGKAGLPVHISAPLLRSNLSMAQEMLDTLSGDGAVRHMAFFLPHSKGRGHSVVEERITRREFESLSADVRSHFSKTPHCTEGEWLARNVFEEPKERTLGLCLNEKEMDRFEHMSAEEIIAFLEALDERYRAQMPALAELAQMYGDPSGERLFRLRDLSLLWSQRYIREHGSVIFDMRDERHHFSVYT